MASAVNSRVPKLRQPVVAHRPQRGRSFSWLYLFPAALVSVLFHAALFAGMYQLSSPTKAVAMEGANGGKLAEAEESRVNQAEQPPPPPPPPESKTADPFLTDTAELDPSVQDDVNPELSNPMAAAEVNVPGLEKPGEKIGTEVLGMANGNPFEATTPGNLGGVSGLSGGLDTLAGMSSGPGIGGEGSGLAGVGNLGGVPLPGSFDARSGARKTMALREGGGTEESEAAVERGLLFLAKLQEPDGRWRLDAPSFAILTKEKSRRIVVIPDRGQANDIAGTALALLPYLANGKHHKNGGKDNPFDKPIEKALAYLLRRQDKKTGNFGGGTMYSHGLATIAVCEAYGLTKDPLLKPAAQGAINYIVHAQHAQGGWRYGPGQAGDTSVVGWQIMALKSGQLARLDVPEATITKAVAFLDSVCTPADEGYGYAGRGSTPTMSAVGLLCRQYIQFWGPNNPHMSKGVERNIKPHMPTVGGKNIYYHYYATQVMHHFGGQAWKSWNEKMLANLLSSQVKEGDLAGSWDSRGDPHGGAGGRVMQTSLSLLTLEVYYRHLPLFQQQ